jgi:hypothetical protein
VSAAQCIVCPTGRVEEEGDRLCPRCALDVDLGGEHITRCACGPCLVIERARSIGGDSPWSWREVKAVRGGHHAPALSLADYLTRRDEAR